MLKSANHICTDDTANVIFNMPAIPARIPQRLWTYAELNRELKETNQPTELWDGELIHSPSPTPEHQRIVFALGRWLAEHVESRRLGQVFLAPLDVVFTPRRVVQPDIIFIAEHNAAVIQDAIKGVPDLVIEVISEGSWRRDRIQKKALYEQFGVKEYWIIDPEAGTIEVFAATATGFQLIHNANLSRRASSRLLKGFHVEWPRLLG